MLSRQLPGGFSVDVRIELFGLENRIHAMETLELNNLIRKIDDLQSRTEALRGYL